MRKILCLITAILTLAAFAGCKKEEKPVFGNKPVLDISQEEIKIGVLTSGDSESENAYIQSHLTGIEAMRVSLGLSEEQVEYKTDLPVDDLELVRAALESCVDDGCKIIFATEKEYAPVVAEVAGENPEVMFCNALSEENNGKNLSGYTVRMYQGQYLSGVVAGYNTKNNLVGYVAYEGEAAAMSGINAFAMGVEKINPEARVYVSAVADRCDGEAQRLAAEGLLALGCDVIGQNTFTAAPLEAAAAAGAEGCGYINDMTSDAPKAHLQAPVVNWGLYYTKAVKEMMEEKWKNENFVGGVSDGFVTLSPVNSNCSRGTTAAVNEARDEILAGRGIFTGPIIDNEGQVVCAEGTALSDGDVSKGMDWHYRNVTVLDGRPETPQ